MAGLVLEPVEVDGPTRWQWLLRTEDGEPLATHQVVVPEGDFEYGGFADLYWWLRWQADPQRRVATEAELTARVGAWIGQHILGSQVMEALLEEAPVTVQVPVPAQLGFLPYRPWGIASWNGDVLAREQVGFVFDLPDTRRRPRTAPQDPAARPVRVLALFSLPTGGTPLGLRRERHTLQQLVRQLGQGQSPRAVQLRVLQYGVTRDALAAAVDDADGWDVLHISGHGDAGGFVLEHDDGSSDAVPPGELVELLYPMRRRLRLSVLAVSGSGAATAAETLRLLHLDEQALSWEDQAVQAADSRADSSREGDGTAATTSWPELGRALVARLGCAVLAMRYPVVDDFAIELTGELYRGLFERGLSVDVALARALSRAAPDPPSLGAPAVSLATPTLLGPATGLRLQPPPGRAESISLALTGFPDEPERFVGRTATLSQARHALLTRSGRAGVLLHGMAGAGKTTAALELAYQTIGTFTAAAFWTAPPADQWQTALNSLAVALETQLNPDVDPDRRPDRPTLQLVGNTATDALLDAYLPFLTELIERARLLIVLDHLESLLTPNGDWLDPRFGRLVTALTGHGGGSRMVLTSRTVPTDLETHRVAVLAVHALTRDEALLLARELPHLRALTHDTEPVTRTSSRVAADRALLARTLTVVQGHPKMLELADAAAADPEILVERVAAAEAAAAARGTPLAAFLATGHSQADPDQLLGALQGWTRAAAAALPEASRLLVQLLAAAEPADRTSPVLDGNWADLWRRTNRPGDPPLWPDALDPIVAAALVDPETAGDPDAPDHPVRYALHPGVADTIRADTPPETLAAVDTELAAYWRSIFDLAWEREEREATGWLVVRAALAAAPYLLRLRQWDTAGAMLQQALHRDQTPATLAAVLPRLQAIADATVGSADELEHQATLARAIATIAPEESERQLRAVLSHAVDRQQYRVAAEAAGYLVELLQDRGRSAEALAVVDEKAKLTRRAALGPWTQLSDAARRLQILAHTGDAEAVFDGVLQLRERMQQLPEERGHDETVQPWNVREATLDVGRWAAMAQGRWQEALDLNAEQLDSLRRRGAGPYELAYSAFNDYWPLLHLSRLEEADRLLRACQDQFEQADDTRLLGKVLSARADLADRQGHREAAIRLDEIALRYLYAGGDARTIAAGHNNLAGRQKQAGAAPAVWLAHRLATALLHRLTGADQDLHKDLHILARDLTAPAAVPATVEQVQATVEQVEGVHLAALIDALEPDPARQQATLDELLRTAHTIPADHAFEVDEHLARWDPVCAAIVAAIGGDEVARHQVNDFLEGVSATSEWAALIGMLRRVLAGERDPDVLLPGLDPIDTAIVTRLLDALGGRIALLGSGGRSTPNQDLVGQWEPALVAVVKAAGGDQTARQQVDELLVELADSPDWAALVRALRRVLGGDRDRDALLTGLDPIDTAIITRLFDILVGSGRPRPPAVAMPETHGRRRR
ncbi:hypothetical protein SAMN05660359_00452 [Geodermatophilus obscurus]|uniref:Uncharacterized protein n=2 Tax=Geodermatophilus obscurus TaxID=1861 RepID=A0A1I5CQT1_9ACTN|nr:hypothetical protein SAMN05660359_00452 [Geodermatophilus obscurus]